MTIPRVLLALAILVLGMMIWGLHKDIYGIKLMLTQQAATFTERFDALNGIIQKPPVMVTKTETKVEYKTKYRTKYKTKYLKPKVPKSRRYMRITQPQFRWDRLLVVTPETPPTYSIPLPP